MPGHREPFGGQAFVSVIRYLSIRHSSFIHRSGFVIQISA